MKSKLGLIVTLVLAGVLTLIPFDAISNPKFEKAYKKDDNTKTWVVYDPAGHMEVGDKFRVKFQANNKKIQLIPLSALRSKWGHKEKLDFLVDLSDEEKYLCGMTKIKTSDHENDTNDKVGHGQWHGFVIKVITDSVLEITWSKQSFGELTGEKRKTMCQATSEQSHGGTAHAEPD